MRLSLVIPVHKTNAYRPALEQSLEVAQKKLKDLDLEVVWEEDEQGNGPGWTRNRAIDRATGDWIGFVDSDDIVGENWLRDAEEVILRNPDADIIRMGTQFDFASDEEIGLESEPANEAACSEVVFVGREARMWALKTYVQSGWCWLNFIRRDFLGVKRFPEGLRIKEDNAFFLRLSVFAQKIVSSKRRGYWYRCRPGSAVRSARTDSDALSFIREGLDVERLWIEESELPRKTVLREFGRLFGWDFVQWSKERLPMDCKSGDAAAYRAFWQQGIVSGRIDWRGVGVAWLPGLFWWLMTADLNVQRTIRAVRDKWL